MHIRPLKESDLEAVYALALEAQLGMTNLPKNKERILKNIKRSISSFAEEKAAPAHHYYFFALEDEGTILGVSAIYGMTGENSPLKYFRLKSLELPKLFKEVPEKMRYLEKVTYQPGPSELCSLYIARKGRKQGSGKLLSLSRFLFIAAFKHRFTSEIFADLRGVTTREGECPFWDHVGSHFLPISYTELMKRFDEGHKEASELIPSSPIYIDLLPKEAIASIGMTHPNTTPALQMLLNQGFQFTHDIDLFDAGPRVLAKKEEITTIKNSKVMTIEEILPITSQTTYLLSNEKIDFRACLGSLTVKNCVGSIDPTSANLLQVKKGDKIRYAIL